MGVGAVRTIFVAERPDAVRRVRLRLAVVAHAEAHIGGVGAGDRLAKALLRGGDTGIETGEFLKAAIAPRPAGQRRRRVRAMAALASRPSEPAVASVLSDDRRVGHT